MMNVTHLSTRYFANPRPAIPRRMLTRTDKGTLGIRLHRAGHILGSVYGVEAQAGRGRRNLRAGARPASRGCLERVMNL